MDGCGPAGMAMPVVAADFGFKETSIDPFFSSLFFPKVLLPFYVLLVLFYR